MIEAFANLASASSLQLTRIFNPEGIVSSSPRVARNELPWVMAACAPQLRRSCAINRNNAMPQSLRRGLLIRGVGATSSRLRGVLPEVSQGSSLLATLGFIAESLWDSRSLVRIKIRVRCSEDVLTPLR